MATIERLEFLGPGRLETREVTGPRLESDAAALVRPIAVATCDLDAMIIAGESPFPAPFPVGHEGVAEVVEVGDDVAASRPGDLVSVPFQISCGSCVACLSGHTGNCREVDFMATYGFGPAVAKYGGFLSDLVLVPFADAMLSPVPAGADTLALASVSDNISDAWRTVAPALEEHPGSPVLVVGGAAAGSIGLYAAGLAVALGSSEVVYVDPDPGRREVAGRLGARALPDPESRRLGPFPITVDASAREEGIVLALRSTAPDGLCTSTAIYFGEPPPLPLLEMYTNVVTFKTGRAHVRPVMPRAIELIASGGFDSGLVTSAVVGWEDAASALAELDWTKLVIRREPVLA